MNNSNGVINGIRNRIRVLRRCVHGKIRQFKNRNVIPLRWWQSSNWGDALNPFLIEKISGKEVVFEDDAYTHKYLCVGSILHFADQSSVIWGSGLISPAHLPSRAPARICAVRGRLTRKLLLDQGLKCPAMFGDPALLLPRFIHVKKTEKYAVGIIPHYTDKGHPWVARCREMGAFVIDVESGTEEFIAAVASCRSILSSSLHGLICADSLQIPNHRIVLNSEIIGGDFKFDDYYGSIECKPAHPISPKVEDCPEKLSGECSPRTLNIDLEKLLKCCPFTA